MFKFLPRFIFAFIANLVALWAAEQLVPSFQISHGLWDFLYVTFIFTLLYTFLRPIIKLFLGPFIILSLGLGLIFINVLILYLLELLTAKVTITGLLPMFYVSFIIGFVNFLFHIFARSRD